MTRKAGLWGPSSQPWPQGSPPQWEYLHCCPVCPGYDAQIQAVQMGLVQLPAFGVWVFKHGCISLPCSHKCNNGCCHPKAASNCTAISKGLLVPKQGWGQAATHTGAHAHLAAGRGAGPPPEST